MFNISEFVTVSASVPVQNQAAAQKLLQKSTQLNHNSRNSRSQRYGGKGKQEESAFLTLDEWERRKTGNDLRTTNECRGIDQDEDLARQLQQQLDLEDIQVTIFFSMMCSLMALF